MVELLPLALRKWYNCTQFGVHINRDSNSCKITHEPSRESSVHFSHLTNNPTHAFYYNKWTQTVSLSKTVDLGFWYPSYYLVVTTWVQNSHEPLFTALSQWTRRPNCAVKVLFNFPPNYLFCRVPCRSHIALHYTMAKTLRRVNLNDRQPLGTFLRIRDFLFEDKIILFIFM
jgi:hypothetical protein